MKTKPIVSTAAAVVLLLAVAGITSCSQNRAEPTTPPTEAPEANVAIDEREVELARRELEAADAERELQELTRIADARARELEAREAAMDRYDEPEQLAVPLEPIEPETTVTVVSLPAATAIEVEFVDALSSEANYAGDGFRATVARDVRLDGVVVIPAGSKVLGSVTGVESAKKIGGQSRMTLSFDRVDLPSGEIVPIRSTLEVAGKSQKKKDAATIGGSAAGGALLGRVFSDKKSKGTAIGAILGAAVGAAVASENKSDPVVVDPGMTVELFLESAVEVALFVDPGDTIAYGR